MTLLGRRVRFQRLCQGQASDRLVVPAVHGDPSRAVSEAGCPSLQHQRPPWIPDRGLRRPLSQTLGFRLAGRGPWRFAIWKRGMKNRRFFACLKSWLDSLARPSSHSQDWSSVWIEGGETDDPLPSVPRSSLRERLEPSAPFFSGVMRREDSVKKLLPRAAGQEDSREDWRRRTLPEMAPRLRRTLLHLYDSPPAYLLRHRSQPEPPTKRPLILRQIPPQAPEVKQEPIQEAQSTLLKTGASKPVRELMRSQRPSLYLLYEIERTKPRRIRVPDFEAKPDSQGGPGGGRPTPIARSSAWLHLGPRLATDLPHFDS